MRKSYDAAFKAKVSLEAVKEESTISDIASKYEIHPNLVVNWKKKFLEKVPAIFIDKRTKQGKRTKEVKEERLYNKIGVLQMENDFLRKKYKQIFGKEPE